MPVTDHDAALQAIAALEQPSPAQLDALHAITALLPNGAPFVDVHNLFALYDTLYFRNLLLSRVEVLWSPRLTLVRVFLSALHALFSICLTRCLLKPALVILYPRPWPTR